MFNSQYNFKDMIMYKTNDRGYQDTGNRRQSSLTGQKFGLNLIVTLDQLSYMKGEITKQVCFCQYKTTTEIVMIHNDAIFIYTPPRSQIKIASENIFKVIIQVRNTQINTFKVISTLRCPIIF